jgi:hypothetical protein
MFDEQLTKNFKLSEFTDSQEAVRRGIKNFPGAVELANIRNFLAPGLQKVRDLLGHPVDISSGYRSPTVNTLVKGSKTSDHMKGLAADFTSRNYGTTLEVCKAILASGIVFDQLIYEGTWVHISFSPTPRKQVLTAVFKKNKPTAYLPGLPT